MLVNKENVRILRDLRFGTKVTVRWHAVGIHDEGDTDEGIVFGHKIGYSDGTNDKIRDIARCIELNECYVDVVVDNKIQPEFADSLVKNDGQPNLNFYKNCSQLMMAALGVSPISEAQAAQLASFVSYVCCKNLHKYVRRYYEYDYNHAACPIYSDTIKDFVFNHLGCNYYEADVFSENFCTEKEAK